jgi:hypothetical protein
MNHSSALEYSSQPPVSVYGTGPYARFSWSLLLVLASPEGYAQGAIPSALALLADPSLLLRTGRRNINLLDIGIATRLNLSTRLTLIRLALIRKPWLFGGQVSRLPYRYLCLHLLFW